MKCEGIRISDSIWVWSVFKRESKCGVLSLQPSRRYLCDPWDSLDLVLLKRYPSLYTSLHSLISSADPAVHCLPTCNVLRNGDFHNNKVISIGGETEKKSPKRYSTGVVAVWLRLLSGGANWWTMAQSWVWKADDCWQMDASESKKRAKGFVRRTGMWGVGGSWAAPLLPDGRRSGMMSAWLSVHRENVALS